MSTRLNLSTLKVESFEPVALRSHGKDDQRGAVDGWSGEYGPNCRSVWPNCEPTIRCI
jgi:hypothetical protein